jgi:outer membrane protein assembly factor BamB
MKAPSGIFLVMTLALSTTLFAEDWANWRGPEQNGISRETGLLDSWSWEEKENVLWSSDTGGRATPIILNDRVYLNCRTNHDFNDPEEKIHCREQVVCWDAKTGDELWRDEFNVFQTDIPSPRVGWAAMCGDKETGFVYCHSVSGMFRCYDPEGNVVWEHSFFEKYGKISGYGGRTQTPIVDEDRVIVSFLGVSWGDAKGPAPKHYYYAFDKKTGDLQWVSAPGTSKPKSTNYSVPVVTVIDGQRMLIGGNSDGGIYAMNARTGAPIWGFKLSLNALNSSPVTDGNLVYICHGEDNVDNTEFGRVQCIDATAGTGDITESGSVWRVDGVKAGYTGLLVKDGILYVVTDTGNMLAFDSKKGDKLWEHDLGTVGKGSPVWADGKIYVTEVNGNIHILKADREGCETLSTVKLKAVAEGAGLDEIYASPAISNGRVVFVTRDRTICIGKPNATAQGGKPMPLAEETAATDEIASLQLRPYETVMQPGQSVDFEVHAFDKNGRFIKQVTDAKLTLADSLSGLKVEGMTVTAPESSSASIAGNITATTGEMTVNARTRMFSTKSEWSWDFEGLKGVAVPPTWMRAHVKIKPVEVDGNTVMKAAGISSKTIGRPSHTVFLGTEDMNNYTIQADVFMTEKRRQMPNIGVTANRYTFMILGNVGKLSMRTWQPHLRLGAEQKYRSDPDVWYTIKFQVKVTDGKANLYGKVWKRDEAEPEEWTMTAEDPHPNESGSPGLFYYATTDCMFDNVKVTFDD